MNDECNYTVPYKEYITLNSKLHYTRTVIITIFYTLFYTM